MSRSRSARRAAALIVLSPLLTAGMLLTAGPASAILTEGEPDSSHCLRVVRLPSAPPAGSTMFGSYGLAAVLVPRADC